MLVFIVLYTVIMGCMGGFNTAVDGPVVCGAGTLKDARYGYGKLFMDVGLGRSGSFHYPVRKVKGVAHRKSGLPGRITSQYRFEWPDKRAAIREFKLLACPGHPLCKVIE